MSQVQVVHRQALQFAHPQTAVQKRQHYHIVAIARPRPGLSLSRSDKGLHLSVVEDVGELLGRLRFAGSHVSYGSVFEKAY